MQQMTSRCMWARLPTMASLVSKLPPWRRSLATVHMPSTSTTSTAVGRSPLNPPPLTLAVPLFPVILWCLCEAYVFTVC